MASIADGMRNGEIWTETVRTDAIKRMAGLEGTDCNQDAAKEMEQWQ